MIKRRPKAWLIKAGTLRHFPQGGAIIQIPGDSRLKVLEGEGACLAEDIVRVMAEDYDLPAPEFIDSTAGLAATDLEWDGQSEYVCEGCGEIESADNRVAYNVFKKSRAEGGN